MSMYIYSLGTIKKYVLITIISLFIVVAHRSGQVASTTRLDEPVSVSIDGTKPRQTMEGFGATHSSQITNVDLLTPSQRKRAVDAVFNQIGIRTGQVPTVIEAPSTGEDFYANRRNDNNDAFIINWNGFNTSPGDRYKQKVVDLVPPEATAELIPDVRINIKWASPWQKAMRHSDYNRFLDEAAEQVLAGVIYWRKTYGREPRFAFLFNEPITGNGELDGGTSQQVIDIIVRSGERLRSAGFNTVKFVAPSEETIEASLPLAQAVLTDKKARQYVGAVGYHVYPYGSNYSYIPRILQYSGSGMPVRKEIDDRKRLAALAAEFGVPVWMTEVSNGLYGSSAIHVQSFDLLRARAIHIHDELEYANASAFYGMNTIWSTGANNEHFGTKIIGNNPDDLVFVDQDKDQVIISGTGYAIGHYARWIKRGSVRLDSSSNDPLVLISAFRNEGQQLVMVAINNASVAKTITVAVKGIGVGDQLKGEQSTEGRYWNTLSPIKTQSPTSFTVTLPPLSVTSLAG